MKNPFKIYFLLFGLLPFQAFCQPHGDCQTAQSVCNQAAIEVAAVVGNGDADEFSNTCLVQEYASTWFAWKIKEPGTLTFTLTPANGIDDLDFAIFKLGPSGDCNDKTLVRCMAAGETIGGLPSQICFGPTGLNINETDTEEPPGCMDGNNNFLAALNCEAGEEYVMGVNNFSQSGEGFVLEWGGSTAFDCDEANPSAASTVAAPQSLLWPNPVGDLLELELPGLTGAASFRVMNGVGRCVRNGNFSGGHLRLETGGLVAGMYYLQVEQGGGVTVRRFVK